MNHKTLISLITIFAATTLWAAETDVDKEKPPPSDSTIGFPAEKVNEKTEPLLSHALKQKPFSFKVHEFEVPISIALFMMKRPALAKKLAESYGPLPLSISKEEEGKGYDITTMGKTYLAHMVEESGNKWHLKFTWFFRFPLGISLKTSGAGAISFHARKLEDNETALDYDLYLAPGGLPIDKLLKGAPAALVALIQPDIETLLKTFIALCEEVAYDPESILEEMEEEPETYTKNEIMVFKRFVKKLSEPST